MITRLETFHDLRAIPIIRKFVFENAIYFGANKLEAQHLELASEEACEFIIRSFKPDPTEPFEITCICDEKSYLSFHFRNRGIPIDKENLPIYDSQDPNASLEGLPLFLLEKMTDSFSLKNEGKNGWVLIFQKQIENMYLLKESIEITEEEIEKCAKEKLEIKLAVPEDAYGIVKLTYQTYHYTYAKAIFYYPEILKQAIADGTIIAFVAKNKKEEIVINCAYARSRICNELVESCMLMSAPAYRKNRSLLRVSRTHIRFVKEQKQGTKVIFANLVTTHTQSQKLTKVFGFTPTAFKLSVHKQVKFIGINGDTTHRESLIYTVYAPNSMPPTIIHLPLRWNEITTNLLKKFSNVKIVNQTSLPMNEKSELIVNYLKDQERAELVFESIGKDWYNLLKEKIFELDTEDCRTFHLRFPSYQPLPPNLDEKLEKLRFIYTGVVLKTLEKWELLYTALYSQNFDFNSINLAYEEGKQFLDVIKQNYLTLKDKIW